MKDIKGYEGLYAVTSCGKVWSYQNEKFLKPFKNNKGYFLVRLYKEKIGRTFKVHRLVAQAYIPNKKKLLEVNHKDECKEHNYINNLEWCECLYNLNYGTRNKRSAKNRMKYKSIRCIENGKIYEDYYEISNDLNINRKNIRFNMAKAIKKGSSIVGYHFEEVV